MATTKTKYRRTSKGIQVPTKGLADRVLEVEKTVKRSEQAKFRAGDDATPIACSRSCATAGRPGPNRVFIRITANQSFTPLVPWPGIPTMLTGTTEVRLQ